MKKILVTGGTGFIGWRLIQRLLKDGNTVWTTSSKREPREKHSNLVVLPQVITENAIKNIRPDFIFHQAAINDTTCNDRDLMFQVNYHSPIQLFQTAYAYGCRKFVYASTTAIYGSEPAPFVEDVTKINPLNCYGESKAAFERFVAEFASHHEFETMVGLRYCNVYGPGEEHKGKRMSMIGQIARCINENKRPLIFDDGEQKRDWIYIDDVIEANLQAINFKGVDIFNCGSGEATSFNQIVEILNKEMGKSLKPEYINNPYKSKYQIYTKCNMEKAKNILNFTPKYDIITGIKDYLNKGLK